MRKVEGMLLLAVEPARSDPHGFIRVQAAHGRELECAGSNAFDSNIANVYIGKFNFTCMLSVGSIYLLGVVIGEKSSIV